MMVGRFSFLIVLLGMGVPALSQYVYTYDNDQGPPPQSDLFDPGQYQYRPPSAVRSRSTTARPEVVTVRRKPIIQTAAPQTQNVQRDQLQHYVPPPRPTFSVPEQQRVVTQPPIIYSPPAQNPVRYRPPAVPRVVNTPPPYVEEVEYIPEEDPEEIVTYAPPVQQPRIRRPQVPAQHISYRPPLQQVEYVPQVQERRPPVEIVTYAPPVQQPRTVRPQVVTQRPVQNSYRIPKRHPVQQIDYVPQVQERRPPVEVVAYVPPVQQTIAQRPPAPQVYVPAVEEPVTYRPQIVQQQQPIAHGPPPTYRPPRRTTPRPPIPAPPPRAPATDDVQIIEISPDQLKNIEIIDGDQYITLPNGQRFQLLSQPSPRITTTTSTTPRPTTTRRPPPPPPPTLPPTTPRPVPPPVPTQPEVQIIQLTADQLKNIETIDGKQYIVMPDGQRFQLLSQPEPQENFQNDNYQRTIPTAPPELIQTERPSTAVAILPRQTTPLPPVYQPPPIQYQPPAQIPAPTPGPVDYRPPRRRRPSRVRSRARTTTLPPPQPIVYVPPPTAAPIRRSPVVEPTERPVRSSTFKPSNLAVAALPSDSDGDGIPGEAGVDYPILNEVPETSFSCGRQPIGGYYADLEAACQLVHFCQAGGIGHSFLCPNGTIFNQEKFSCQWWYKVNCATASQYYALNDKLYKVPSTTLSPRQVAREERRRQRQNGK